MSRGADAAADDDDVKKSIALFGNKQQLLSIDMKTKVVQHVPRLILMFSKLSSFLSCLVVKFDP